MDPGIGIYLPMRFTIPRATAFQQKKTAPEPKEPTTAEKRAMGFYLDGRASAVFGTHTHVQTNDAQVLPCGTGYITDIGMTGPIQSVLGITPSLAIEKMKTNLPVRFQNPDGECRMEGCIFEIDNKTGKTLSAQLVSVV